MSAIRGRGADGGVSPASKRKLGGRGGGVTASYWLKLGQIDLHKYTIEIVIRKRDTEVRNGKVRYRHCIALPMRESMMVSRVEWARRFELAVSLVGYAISTRYRVFIE
uniref:Uncharacterized protein n=1 Tax=Oryza sativa subsp. japonica TaxID=39947 RepID=Q10H85_ORYSJ|nr:hypothetical protein LOC_Os03g40084 [Oryza sativa Japonica Group]